MVKVVTTMTWVHVFQVPGDRALLLCVYCVHLCCENIEDNGGTEV
jgi:hypothetical protein